MVRGVVSVCRLGSFPEGNKDGFADEPFLERRLGVDLVRALMDFGYP